MGGTHRPGRSMARTGAKHALLNGVVGALAGMASRPGVRAAFPGGQVMVDMTAGDIVGGPAGPTAGALFDISEVAPDEDASHAILMRHAGFRGVPASVWLFERNAAQAARLASFYAGHSYVHVTAGPSHELVRQVVPMTRRASLLLVDDPNSTASSTLTPEAVGWAFDWAGTTLIACMGVNAGGVAKGVGHYEASRERYARVLSAAREQRGRYAAAARLANDAHRWGYLVITTAAAERAVRQEIERMHRRTSMRVEPAYGFAEVERMLDAMHTPRGATA